MHPTRDPFLLHPENIEFVAGTRARPHSQASVVSIVILGSFVACGFVPAIQSYQNHVLHTELRAIGIHATGHVVELTNETDDDGVRHYFASFDFETQRGRVSGRRRILEEHYLKLGATNDVEIVYLERDPAGTARLTLVGERSAESNIAITVFWVGLLGIPLVAQIRSLRVASRLSKAPRAHARVVSASGDKDSDGDFFLTICYAYQSPTTFRPVEGTAKGQRPDMKDMPLPAPGTPLLVLHAADEDHLLL